MEKNYFEIKGLTCVACTKLVSGYIHQLEGIHDVRVELSGNSVVTADRIINKSEIRGVLTGSGFDII